MLLTFTFTGKPSDAQSHKFRIHVTVSCTRDKHTESLIQSWIKREFRSLSDVSIVSFDDASYILSVTAVEPTYRATGRKTGGIAVGTMFIQRSFTAPGLYYLPYTFVHSDNTKDLEGLCKSIVANIDTDNLEPVRELFQ